MKNFEDYICDEKMQICENPYIIKDKKPPKEKNSK